MSDRKYFGGMKEDAPHSDSLPGTPDLNWNVDAELAKATHSDSLDRDGIRTRYKRVFAPDVTDHDFWIAISDIPALLSRVETLEWELASAAEVVEAATEWRKLARTGDPREDYAEAALWQAIDRRASRTQSTPEDER